MTSKFNPFGKEISKLEASDLAILREVYEGWFVEYKQKIETKDLAKQIAAFANSNGGLLFIGIKEKDGKERTASEFPGVTDIDKTLATVRNAASVHIHPQFTGYTPHVIKGPNDEIGLEEGQAIIVIEIQAGSEPPYIHSSGQIYRRFDDESRPEKDRLELDKLYAKGEKFNQWFIDYYTQQPTLLQPELPRLFLYFISDPRETDQEEKVLISFDEFRNIMQGKEVDKPGIIYDNFHGSFRGYTARQVNNNNPNYDLLLFTWRLCGDAFVEIPLNLISYDNLIQSILTKYPVFSLFFQLIGEYKLPVIDYTPIALSIWCVMNQFLCLRRKSNIKSLGFVKVKLINTGNTIPFFNSPFYTKNISDFGIPITRYNEIWFPPGKNFDSFEKLDLNENNPMALIISLIFKSVGLLNDSQDNDTWLYQTCEAKI
jgi:hypothetical protein